MPRPKGFSKALRTATGPCYITKNGKNNHKNSNRNK